MTTCRPATAADYPAYVRLFGELAIPDPVSSEDRYVEQVVPRTVVACEGAAVVGYATWRAYGAVAHVVNVAVDRAVRGRRVGQVLLEHVRGLARDAGCTRWYLNVKDDNAAALRLYARCGLVREHRNWALEIPWAKARAMAVAAGAAGLARPEEDAAIAARFGVPGERLAMFRGRATTQLVVVRDPEPVAFAAFDPTFPGAPVFAAVRPELAGALLAACDRVADHARFDFIRVTVEGDEGLAETLLAAGAQLTFALLQLGAAI